MRFIYLVYSEPIAVYSDPVIEVPSVVHHDPDTVLARVKEVFLDNAIIRVWRAPVTTPSAKDGRWIFHGPRSDLTLTCLRKLT